MIVVGIDPSLTNCGIAILNNAKPALLQAIGHGSPNGLSYNHRSDRIVSQCRAVIKTIDKWAEDTGEDYPELAVIEGPAYGANLPSNHDRAGLWWGIYSTLRTRVDGVAVVAPKTRAAWATGNGNADKRAVLNEVRTWWPHRVANHDIADAAVLALMGSMQLGATMPFLIKPRHQHGLDVVKWPAFAKAPA